MGDWTKVEVSMNPKDMLVAKEVAAGRLAICQTCPHYLKAIKVCRICGCVMPLKTKLKSSRCADDTNIRWRSEK